MCGDKPFQSSYLPSCMYSVAPYYETTDSTSTLTTTTENNNNMASILPLPLLPTDIDLNDVNIKSTLEDVLSRQMLLLCRLNQLEQQLLERQSSQQSGAATATLEPPKITATIDEDLVIQFSIDDVPYSLFALVAALRKGSTPVMANLHLHSSVVRQPAVISRVNALKSQLARILNFTFTSSGEYLTRSQFPLIVTFIVTSTATKTHPKAIFQAGKKLVEGEFNIARAVLQLFNADQAGQSEPIWSLLTNASTLASDKAIIEQLGSTIFNLSDTVFLLQQSSPSLLDVVLWSLTVAEFQRPTGTVATTLRGSQLLNSKWQSAIRQFVSK